MGTKRKNKPKSKNRVGKREKPRKLTGDGKLKKQRGDSKIITSRNVGFQVKQKKGGKWVKTGERQCKIHTKCDCVRRTDPAKLRNIYNR